MKMLQMASFPWILLFLRTPPISVWFNDVNQKSGNFTAHYLSFTPKLIPTILFTSKYISDLSIGFHFHCFPARPHHRPLSSSYGTSLQMALSGLSLPLSNEFLNQQQEWSCLKVKKVMPALA